MYTAKMRAIAFLGLEVALATALGGPVHAAEFSNSRATLTASSTAPATKLKGKRLDYEAVLAFDNRPDTAWCAGSAASGQGDTVTITFDNPQAWSKVEVDRDMPSLAGGNRVVTLTLVADGKDSTISLPDGAKDGFRFEGLSPSATLTFRIDAVSRGAGDDRTCLPEIRLHTKNDVQLLPLFLAKERFDDLMAFADALREAMNNQDQRKFTKLIKFPLAVSLEGWKTVRHRNERTFKRTSTSIKSAKELAWRFHFWIWRESISADWTLRMVGTSYVASSQYGWKWTIAWVGGSWKLTALTADEESYYDRCTSPYVHDHDTGERFPAEYDKRPFREWLRAGEK